MKRYGCLTGRVAAVGGCYGLAFELQNTVYAEIFAEQEANGIFAIIFSRITGSSWKGSMLSTVTNL